MIDYGYLISEAIKRNQVENLLCGIRPYEIPPSEFVSDVFPTDINAVMVYCFYKQFGKVKGIKDIFQNSIEKMLSKNAREAYIAILYFDSCLFDEERDISTFTIDRNLFIQLIRKSIERYKDDFEKAIVFDNGNVKKYPLKTIRNFNEYYKREYGFSIF